MEQLHTQQKYSCPMHPQIMQDKPGNCPICGMTLVLTKVENNRQIESHHQHAHNPSMGHAGHDHNKMIADFRKRFYVVLILTIPIMLLSEMIQHFMGVDWQFPGSKYILFALSTIVFIYGGFPFLKGLVDEVKAKNPGMMFLIGFAITVAYI
jgi:Cu2+-exporting ATPase